LRRFKKFVALIILISLFSACGHNVVTNSKASNNDSTELRAEEKYSRKLYKHWSDKNKDCLDTRAEILRKRSLIPVATKKKGCKIVSGAWDDYYFNEKLYTAKQVDIDHLIPLKNAHLNGASEWTSQEKEIFANDPENLVITNKRYNRSKGAKGIDKWLPIEKPYACKYVRDWVKIKKKYGLNLSEPEVYSINAIKPTCKSLGISF
jgi:hypothetical protein